LPVARRRAALEDLLQPLVGATVFAFACGSSSVPAVTRIGHSARWAALVALLAVAALVQVRRRSLSALSAAGWAAAAFVLLAIVSAAWSVAPRLSVERGLSLGLLFLTCVLLAAAGRPSELLVGVLGGAVAVALAGVVLLAVAHARAVQPASYATPARYQGFGQDPNTVALLLAVVLPLALWALLEARSPLQRLAAFSALGLLAGSIVASGSRGGLLAAGVGAFVVLLSRGLRRRATLLGAAAIAAAVVVGAAIQTLPKASPLTGAPAPPAHAAPLVPKPRPGYHDAEREYPLDADIGLPLPGGGQPTVTRSLFGASGRLDAWQGALHDVVRRPLAGHGFGTERTVFVDRYYRFVGGLPENSYIGLALQLGVAGLLVFATLVVALVRPGLRAPRGPRRALAGAGLGVLAAGLAIACVQSYVYSVGNLAAAALWIPAFLVPAASDG
jgi:O-antigen ligase